MSAPKPAPKLTWPELRERLIMDVLVAVTAGGRRGKGKR